MVIFCTCFYQGRYYYLKPSLFATIMQTISRKKKYCHNINIWRVKKVLLKIVRAFILMIPMRLTILILIIFY